MTDIYDIAKQIVADEYKYGYEPIYFDRGYVDTDEQIVDEFLSGGDWRMFTDVALSDWASESVWNDAVRLSSENYEAHSVDESDLCDALQEALYDACTQDYELEYVQNMRPQAVRFQLDENPDPIYVTDPITPEIFLAKANLAATDKNIAAARSIIANALSHDAYCNMFAVFTMSLSDVDDMADTIRITGDVEVWATNVYQGDGWSETMEVDITIPRSKLSTDYGAQGYSWCEVFGSDYGHLPTPDVKFFMVKENANA